MSIEREELIPNMDYFLGFEPQPGGVDRNSMKPAREGSRASCMNPRVRVTHTRILMHVIDRLVTKW